ncbi:aminoglycoside 6'-N-acetyltransferase [Pullulanibacillus pueri]|uniref:N-acetyltransferase n=1 Tax=Pullulanibacillus pueri TaxID=1437324 RepID=A0A8J2ZTA9_9BACL|nr:GNAT family N-acetyltransferase [Pullulanibacillus pueri]MBM7681133.1 aminoglycoside 6'-N-acetyltransferase [Pullulanibacillus pueri]GGH77173.1 N-acetyltransferase [Pullulanibacillus pueri]
MLYKKDKLVIRKLKEADKNLLVKWLSDPCVLQYYEGRDRPHDLEMVTAHFYHRPSNVTGCIIEFEGHSIGYIQFYPIDEEEREEYGYQDVDEKIYGTDQFIGEVGYWNSGIGQQLVRSMIEYLVEKEKVDRVVMDPQAWNKRAIACYEKCKLRKVKELPKHELHEGVWRDCWLMEYKK